MSDGEMKLVVEIKNTTPMELTDLVGSLAAVALEYRSSVEYSRTKLDLKKVKLYLKDVRSGSVITELVALAPGLLPFVEYGESILEFSEYLKSWKEWLIGDRKEPPAPVTKNTMKNISEIMEPVAKDHGAQMNIRSITAKGDVHVHLHINSTEANAIQNRCNKLIDEMKEPVTGWHYGLTMYLYQARNEIGEKVTGDKAIIESISTSPVKLMFQSEEIKQQILEEDHPFAKAFIVDVLVGTVRDKPVTYTVGRLLQAIDLEN